MPAPGRQLAHPSPAGACAGCPSTVTCAPVASVTRAAPNSCPAVHAPGLTPARTRWVGFGGDGGRCADTFTGVQFGGEGMPAGPADLGPGVGVGSATVRCRAGDVCHHVGGAAGQPGRLEVTDRPGQHLPLRAAEGQDRGAAAEGLLDHLIVTVGDGNALRQGLLDRLAHTVALAGHPGGGCDPHQVRHHAHLLDQAQDQRLGRGRPEPGPGDQRDRVRACLLVAVEQSPYRRPFVRDIHIGHSWRRGRHRSPGRPAGRTARSWTGPPRRRRSPRPATPRRRHRRYARPWSRHRRPEPGRGPPAGRGGARPAGRTGGGRPVRPRWAGRCSPPPPAAAHRWSPDHHRPN